MGLALIRIRNTQQKTKAAIPHEDVLQENAVRRSNYRESTASVEERVVQIAEEVNNESGNTSGACLHEAPISERSQRRSLCQRGMGMLPHQAKTRKRLSGQDGRFCGF